MGQRDKDYILSGVIELGDAYLDASKSNGKRGRGTDKTSVLIAVSLTEQGASLFPQNAGFPIGCPIGEYRPPSRSFSPEGKIVVRGK